MTKTPDFEDWMARQEIPIEDTLTIDSFITSFTEKFEFTYPRGATEPSAKQKAVLTKMWAEKYDLLMPYNIRPVTYTYATGPRAGQEETRWVIAGEPGLWSAKSMREIFERITGE